MIQTTSRCNSACVICPYPNLPASMPRGDMDQAVFTSVVDEIATYPPLDRVMLYLMNEPLCDRRIVQRIRYTRSKLPDTEIYILTNGINLTDEITDRLLDAGLSWIGLSVHAVEPQTYAKITGRKDFAKIRQRLERFVQRALDRKGPDFVQVNVTRIRPFVSQEEFAKAEVYWRGLGLRRVDLDNGYISRAGNVAVYGHDPVYRDRIIGCDTIWAYIMAHVLFDGTVIPCCMDWGRKVAFGNVREKSLLDIWRGEGRLGFLETIGSGKELSEGFLCSGCEDAVPATQPESVEPDEPESRPKDKAPLPLAQPSCSVPKESEPVDKRIEALKKRFQNLDRKMDAIVNRQDIALGKKRTSVTSEFAPSAPVTRMDVGLLGQNKSALPNKSGEARQRPGEAVLVLLPPASVAYPPIELAAPAAFAQAQGYRVLSLDLNIRMYDRSGDHLRSFWEAAGRDAWLPGQRLEQLLAFHEPVIADWIATLAQAPPRLIAFAVNGGNRHLVQRVALRVKRQVQNVFVALFGNEISPTDPHHGAASDAVDGVVVGDSEETLTKLLGRLRKASSLADLAGFIPAGQSGSIVAKRESITSLERIPAPPFADFDLQLYTGRALPLIFSRGDERAFYVKSPDVLFEEITHYKRELSGFEFVFTEGPINADPGVLDALCEKIIQAGVVVAWSGSVRIDQGMDAAFFKKLARAGCMRLSLLGQGSSAEIQRLQKHAVDACIEIEQAL